jgi:hypothetical protein
MIKFIRHGSGHWGILLRITRKKKQAWDPANDAMRPRHRGLFLAVQRGAGFAYGDVRVFEYRIRFGTCHL